MVELSRLPAEMADEPAIPVTPSGFDGVAVSIPKPKSVP